MAKKHSIRTVVLALCFVVWARDAHCIETCYIDDSPLFLYKTINWWYDSLPEESDLLCGKPVKCKRNHGIRVVYDAQLEKIDIVFTTGFASMLLPIKDCGQCYGPSHFYCAWLAPDYFGGTCAVVMQKKGSAVEGFTFSKINRRQAKRIQALSGDLEFELEGVVGGLANGRIALHASGDLLKKCSATSAHQRDGYPITLKIIDARTRDILAVFKMDWAH